MLHRLFRAQVFAVCASFLWIGAGAASEPDQEHGFWNLIERLTSQVEKLMERDVSVVDVTRILGRSCEFSPGTTDLSSDLLEEAEYWEKNFGLELRGGITSGDLRSDSADEQGATYLELSWDVLASGYKEYDYRARELRRRAALERVRSELESTAEEYRCRAYQIDSAFDAIEARLSRQKLQLMEAVYSVEKRAYFNGDSSLNEYLISEESLTRLRRRLQFLATIPQHGKQSHDTDNPPAIDLDIEALLNEVRQDPRYAQLTTLQQQGILNSNPYHDGNRLRLFLRQEFDLLDSDRDDVVAGLRFSIPWSFGKRPGYQARLQQL